MAPVEVTAAVANDSCRKFQLASCSQWMQLEVKLQLATRTNTVFFRYLVVTSYQVLGMGGGVGGT